MVPHSSRLYSLRRYDVDTHLPLFCTTIQPGSLDRVAALRGKLFLRRELDPLDPRSDAQTRKRANAVDDEVGEHS